MSYQKLSDGDYKVTINSYLTFLNSLLTELNQYCYDTYYYGVHIPKEVLGNAVKHALTKSNRKGPCNVTQQ